MLTFISAVVVGFIVGLLARAIRPGDDKMGWLMTTLLGIGGSFVATYVGIMLNWYKEGESAGWIASIGGAITLLVLYDLLRPKK